MHGPINVKSPNTRNTCKWHMGFNSAFKGLIFERARTPLTFILVPHIVYQLSIHLLLYLIFHKFPRFIQTLPKYDSGIVWATRWMVEKSRFDSNYQPQTFLEAPRPAVEDIH
jgi:hypothetical protein